MKTAVLKVTRWMAKEEAKKWAVGKTKQDQLIAKAYRTIARGKKVIDLNESMSLSGCDAQGRPMLAIARADSTRVNGFIYQGGTSVTFRSNKGYNSDKSIPADCFSGLTVFQSRARVPIIPPLLRQANLSRLWILFEAAWEKVTKDPMLLEHLGGALYRVVGVWDLTPVEQAVLRGRP